MVRVAQAASDENWGDRGYTPGDQRQGPLKPDGTQDGEVNIVPWYDSDWTHVFRPISNEVAEFMAREAEKAAVNPHVGYTQPYCLTFYNAFKEAGWDASKINIDCGTHCAAFISALGNGAGLVINPQMYTGNEVAALMRTGAFNLLTDISYTTTDAKLKRGDILFRLGHTCIVLDDAEKKEHIYNPYVVIGSNLRFRRGPGMSYSTMYYMKLGDILDVYDFIYDEDGETIWPRGEYKGQLGYASMKYLAKEQNPDSQPDEQKTMKTTQKTRLRTGPGILYNHVCYVPKGEEVVLLGGMSMDSRGITWYEVAYGQYTGWSSGKYLAECT